MWPQCGRRTQHFVNKNTSDPPDKAIMKLQSCYYPSLQVGRAGLLVPALPAVMESLGLTEGWLLGRGLQGWDCRRRGISLHILSCFGFPGKRLWDTGPCESGACPVRGQGWGAGSVRAECLANPQGQGQKG